MLDVVDQQSPAGPGVRGHRRWPGVDGRGDPPRGGCQQGPRRRAPVERPHARRAGIARARRHLRARRDLAHAQADRAGVADGRHAGRSLVTASRRHRVPARDQRVPELRHQRDECRHQFGQLRGRALGGRCALHLHRLCQFDRRLPAGTDGDHVRRPAPDEPLRCRRCDCDLGRARRHGAAWRRHGLPRLLARPVLRALPDDQPERRRDDAVAGRGLRQQPARAGRATAARRLLARSSAAARRCRGYARRRARRLRQRAGLQLGLLHQSGRAGPRRAAVLGTRPARSASTSSTPAGRTARRRSWDSTGLASPTPSRSAGAWRARPIS